MVKLLDALRGIRVATIVPLLSDIAPSVFITPEYPADLVKIKILCHEIRNALNATTDWEYISLNQEWLLRLTVPSHICVDVSTRLPSVKEAPISL